MFYRVDNLLFPLTAHTACYPSRCVDVCGAGKQDEINKNKKLAKRWRADECNTIANWFIFGPTMGA